MWTPATLHSFHYIASLNIQYNLLFMSTVSIGSQSSIAYILYRMYLIVLPEPTLSTDPKWATVQRYLTSSPGGTNKLCRVDVMLKGASSFVEKLSYEKGHSYFIQTVILRKLFHFEDFIILKGTF